MTAADVVEQLDAGTVYLLHFDPPFRHARHYAGWTERPVEVRLAEHARGAGARLVHAAIAAGCSVSIVRVWPNADRAFERVVKASVLDPRTGRWHNRALTDRCPRCSPRPTVVGGRPSRLLADYCTDGQLSF